MSKQTSVAPRRKAGRPRSPSPLRLLASNFDQATCAAIENLREHREREQPNRRFATSHAIRELVLAALSEPQYAEFLSGPEPSETSSPLESDTKKP